MGRRKPAKDPPGLSIKNYSGQLEMMEIYPKELPEYMHFALEMFGHALLKYYADPLSVRLLNAMWIRVFNSQIPGDEASAKFCEDAWTYFQWLLRWSLCQFRSTRVEEHFLACLYTILGELKKRLPMQSYSGSIEPAQKLASHEIIELHYNARKNFYLEGRIYTELSLIYGDEGLLFESCLYATWSILSAFRSQSEVDVMESIEDLISSEAIQELNEPQLKSLKWVHVLMKAQIDATTDFEEEICCYQEASRHCMSEFVTNEHPSKCCADLMHVCILTILMNIYCCGSWRKYCEIGKEITRLLNALNLQLNEDKILVLTEPNYESKTKAIQLCYLGLPTSFSTIVCGSKLPITSLAGLKSTTDFLINLCINLMEKTEDYMHSYCPHIFVILIWLITTGRLQAQLYPYADLMRSSLHKFVSNSVTKALQVFSFTDKMLSYELPEDKYLTGIINMPLSFCLRGSQEILLAACLVNCHHFDQRSVAYQAADKCINPSCHHPGCQLLHETVPGNTQYQNLTDLFDFSFSPVTTCLANHVHVKATNDLDGSYPEEIVRLSRILVIAGNLIVPAIQKDDTVTTAAPNLVLRELNVPKAPKEHQRLIVIDGPNVAMRHGGFINKKFSTRGIQLALNYYLERNFKVVVFVPETAANYESVAREKRIQEINPLKYTKQKVPDAVEPLVKLAEQGVLIRIPSGDYDDSYMICYARNQKGCIISNDMFRDYIDKAATQKEANEAQEWIKSHVITFIFVDGLFMPNPQFMFPDGFPSLASIHRLLPKNAS